jgi:hypothetical protein
MHHYRFTILIILGVLLAGTAAWAQPDQQTASIPFVGIFVTENGNKCTTISQKADGSFTSETVVDGKHAWSIHGKWFRRDDQIVWTYSSSDSPNIKLNEENYCKVISFDTNSFSFITHTGATKTYVRKTLP